MKIAAFLIALEQATEATVQQVAATAEMTAPVEPGPGYVRLSGAAACAQELDAPFLRPALLAARADFKTRLVTALKALEETHE